MSNDGSTPSPHPMSIAAAKSRKTGAGQDARVTGLGGSYTPYEQELVVKQMVNGLEYGKIAAAVGKDPAWTRPANASMISNLITRCGGLQVFVASQLSREKITAEEAQRIIARYGKSGTKKPRQKPKQK